MVSQQVAVAECTNRETANHYCISQLNSYRLIDRFYWLIYVASHVLGEFKLNVVNCVNVIVAANAFNDTAFHGFFEKISDLRFETNAFHGNRDSKIEIVGSNVGLLEKMDASMKEVKIVNSRIEAIKSNTFNVLSINSIEFINCDIGVIEPNATTEKVDTTN